MFDHVVIINLDRRPDRWLQIGANLAQIDWPFAEPIRVAAHDGLRHPPPACFGHTPGAWGCLVTHLKVCKQAIRDGVESLLIFEDDAFFPLDFALRARRFLDAVPDDWESLYLGGRHYLKSGWPRPINREVLQGVCVLGTWAYALRGRAIRALGRTLEQAPQAIAEDKFNVDRIFALLHQDRAIRAYTPWEWAVHHGGGRSDINGLEYRTNDFNLPEDVLSELRQQLPQEAMT